MGKGGTAAHFLDRAIEANQKVELATKQIDKILLERFPGINLGITYCAGDGFCVLFNDMGTTPVTPMQLAMLCEMTADDAMKWLKKNNI